MVGAIAHSLTGVDTLGRSSNGGRSDGRLSDIATDILTDLSLRELAAALGLSHQRVQ